MADAVSSTVAAYEDAVEHLKDMSLSGMTKASKEKLVELIRAVNLKEHEADNVESKEENDGNLDNAIIIMEYSNGIMANINCSRISKNYDQRI